MGGGSAQWGALLSGGLCSGEALLSWRAAEQGSWEGREMRCLCTGRLSLGTPAWLVLGPAGTQEGSAGWDTNMGATAPGQSGYSGGVLLR